MSLAAIGILALPHAPASASELSHQSAFLSDEATFKAQLETSLEHLFCDVLIEDDFGTWHVDHQAARRYFPSDQQEIQRLCDTINELRSPSNESQRADAVQYARCIVTSAVGIDNLFDINYRQIADWVWSKSWKKIADYLWPKVAKHAGKVALKGAVKFSPGGLAIAVAWAALECVGALRS